MLWQLFFLLCRILNKLTPEKFDVLKGQLIDSGITTPDILKVTITHLECHNLLQVIIFLYSIFFLLKLRSLFAFQGVIELIFDKAVLEPTFCPMYALLCSDLNEKLPPFPSDEPGGKDITFKRIDLTFISYHLHMIFIVNHLKWYVPQP